MNDGVNTMTYEVEEVRQGKIREIPNCMDTLREEVTNLGAEIETLRSRLNPVCSKLSEKTPEITPDPPAITDLGESISNIIDSLRVDTAMLVNILDSIEL